MFYPESNPIISHAQSNSKGLVLLQSELNPDTLSLGGCNMWCCKGVLVIRVHLKNESFLENGVDIYQPEAVLIAYP